LGRQITRSIIIAFGCVCLFLVPARGQENYEIQVYASETIPRGVTMVELHNNFAARGTKKTDDATLPTNHAWHETIEITHGFNDWFETGFYTFTSARNGSGWDFVGTHIRPRFRVPPKWHWPVGVSLSQEIGYVRRQFSEDQWSWEIRPIVDKEMGKWYLSFNPVLERALSDPGTKRGFEFAPNVKVAYSATKKVDVGMEYYGSLGTTQRVRSSARATASDLSGHRPECIPEVGIQFWCRHRHDTQHGPSHLQNDSWPAL
jgi:hypothetical protein